MTYLLKKAVLLAIVLAVGLVGYNYFYGTPEEKANSQEIIGKVKDLTGSVTSLLQSEKSKYHAGKYDDALAKMHTTFSTLREKATALGQSGKEALDKINALESRETELEKELAQLEQTQGSQTPNGNYGSSPQNGADQYEQRAEQIRQELLDLNRNAERLGEELNW